MRQPIQLLKDSVEVFKGKWKLLLSITAIVAILSLLESLLAPSYEEGGSLAHSLIAILLVVANIFASVALILAITGRVSSLQESYQVAVSFFWRYLGLSIVVGVASLVAYLLLIIPGIIVSVWWAFAAFILILEGKGIVDSMKQSREYVRGKWWGVFGRMVLLGVVVIAVSIVIGMIAGVLSSGLVAGLASAVITLVVTPFAVSYMYLLYQDVKGITAEVSISEPPIAPAVHEAM